MKYKIGDKVRVKSVEWYNKNKNKQGSVPCDADVTMVPAMAKLCNCIVTIERVYNYTYKIKESKFQWTDDMFEGLVFENIVFPNENYADKVELCLGNDYEIVVEDNRTFIQKKKPKYPMTYGECCGVLGMTFDYPDIRMVSTDEFSLYSEFIRLIRCRDAYWKIAGEYIGLGKPWKQDYDDRCFIIANNNGNIHTYEYHGNNNVILAFPTKEMRDVFYDNFKELIEKCKELL
jgi:hypothetical protein